MKSSAPQTVMQINLAPMIKAIKAQPPKGAESLPAMRERMRQNGAQISQRKLSKDMLLMQEESGGKIKSGMYPYKGRNCKWYWEVK